MGKKKSILIRLDEEDHQKYKKLCKDNGFNMSQRLRNFVKNEIENNKKKDG
jgi:antitoxin component of RelBE/YafQ-DinJ toxin-antitoxin module